MANKASSSVSIFDYHVYMTFRHKDIGRTFADHLYTSLLNAGFRTFRNEDELEEDGRSHQEISNMIQGSKVGLVIFSENYPFSERCLDELVCILESRRTSKIFVLPVFYNVDPSDVRKQKGTFDEAFSRYEERCQKEMDDGKKNWMEKVKQWRIALKEVADMGGMVSQNQADGYESRFIKEIVKVIGRKLERTILDVAMHPIGLDARVKEIDSWLQDGSTEVGVFVISGMGGIGKTTIAKTAYNLNFDKFEGSCFLADIRKASEHHKGLVRLQRQLLSNILRKKVEKIHNVDAGIVKIQEAVSCRKVLLVLDDVDDTDQIKAVLIMREWFCPGSKIIITTRNEHLLKIDESCKIYKVKVLDKMESLQLFSFHAFGKDQPLENYMDISRNIARKCGGNPLALKVLGSSLSKTSMEIWEGVLKKLKAIPDHAILEKLRISFDYLPDDHDQSLFLDIVCFFVGKNKQFARTILDGCGFHSVVGIQNLIDRCLLTIDKDEKLKMHQLVQDMGREIIRQESPWLPGKRSRVWDHKDSYNVLTENTGTIRIEGLVLDMQILEGLNTRTKVDSSSPKKRRKIDFLNLLSNHPRISKLHEFRTEAFSKLQKLRILRLSYAHLLGFYNEFSNGVRWLYWKGFPLKSIPIDFPLDSVVALDMRDSRLEQLWNRTKYLSLLKILNLSHSQYLKTTPDFSALPNLQSLMMKDCKKLVGLHESIGILESLIFLNLRDCVNLRKFPRSFGMLKSLEKLIISGCTKLNTSISELGKLESLTVLHADNVKLNQPANFHDIPWREILSSWFSIPEKSPESVNLSLATLSHSLVNLSLSNCDLRDDAFAVDLSSLSSLRFLNLCGNPIYGLSQSIIRMTTLQDLWLDECRNLQSLPELPSSITKLKTIDCTSLGCIRNLPNLLDSLFLDVTGCEKLSEVQGLFKLEPICNFGDDMIGSLGNIDLDSIQGLEVELYNRMTLTKKKFSVQGLLEFDIFSGYLPGRQIPTCFDYVGRGTSILSFTISVERESTIQGLNIGIVYARSSQKSFRYWGENRFGGWYNFYINVSNVTKGLKWVYGPTFIGIPGAEEDLTFLCHWKFGNQLEIGDEINVSLRGWSFTFQMKQFGIYLDYETREELDDDGTVTMDLDKQSRSYDRSSSDIEKYMSTYLVGSQAYFFSQPDYFVTKNRSDDDPIKRSIIHDRLFEDPAKTTALSSVDVEEGDEVEDIGYDYDYSDDEFEEADAEKELQELLELSD